MILEGLHEKDIFTGNHPFRLEVSTSIDFYYPLHWHNAIELVYVPEGICRMDVNGLDYSLGAREILLVPSGEIHDINSFGPGKRFFIQFDPSILNGFGDVSIIPSILSQTVKISCEENAYLHKALEKLLSEIIKEYEAKETAYTLTLSARILDILVLLSRNLTNGNAQDYARNAKKVFGLEKINSSFKFIESNYQNDITLKDVSKAVGFSEYHFSRLFKEIAEKNFHHYLNEFRIKKAERLLANNDMSIAQIAHEVGFNSITTFNRTFRKIKGCPPTAYRMK